MNFPWRCCITSSLGDSSPRGPLHTTTAAQGKTCKIIEKISPPGPILHIVTSFKSFTLRLQVDNAVFHTLVKRFEGCNDVKDGTRREKLPDLFGPASAGPHKQEELAEASQRLATLLLGLCNNPIFPLSL